MAFGNELLGINEDIKFDLNQIRLSFQEEERLSDDQRRRLKNLPKKLQEEKKEEILKKKRDQKKEEMRRWALQLEENVAMSDYPPEIKSRILSLTEKMKYSRFNLANDIVERQISEIKRQIEAYEYKKALGLANKKRENKVGEAILAGTVGAVIAGAALGPFIQVRYSEEAYKELTNNYVENKILPELRSGKIKEIPTSKSYAKKTGAKYSSRHEMAEREIQGKIDNEITSLTGISKEELERLNPVKRRAAERYVLGKKPELAAEKKQAQEEVAAGDIIVGLLRQERRGKVDALRALEEQKAALEKAVTPENREASNAQIAAISERIAERRKEGLAMALFVESLSKISLEKRKESLMAEEHLDEKEKAELKQIQERLPKLNERLAMHRIEASALGLKVDGFEKALIQKGILTSLLKSAQPKGKMSLEALTDQIMIMAKTGTSPFIPTQSKSKTSKKVQVEGKKMQIALGDEGISGRLKEEIKRARTMKRTKSPLNETIEKVVATNRKEAKAKTKTIRLRVNPQNAAERAAASQLKATIAKKLNTRTGSPVKEADKEKGFKGILKEVSKSSTENIQKEGSVAEQKVPQRTSEEIQRINEILRKEMAENGGFKAILQENSSLVKSKRRVKEVPQRLLDQRNRYREAG